MGAKNWTSPADALPAEGQVVEISILKNSHDVSLARRLGDSWWIDRRRGGPVCLMSPKTPAYWRYPENKQVAKAEGRS